MTGESIIVFTKSIYYTIKNYKTKKDPNVFSKSTS